MKKTAIVLTAHPAQQKFWPPVLQCLENYPGPLILAYDDSDTAPIPDEILIRFAAVAVTGRPAGQLGHGPGELLCMKKGFAAAELMGAEYILKLGFDDAPYRWRNLELLRLILVKNYLDFIDGRTRVVYGAAKKLGEMMRQANLEVRKGSAESYWDFAAGKTAARRKSYNAEWWTGQIGLIHLQGEYALNNNKTTS